MFDTSIMFDKDTEPLPYHLLDELVTKTCGSDLELLLISSSYSRKREISVSLFSTWNWHMCTQCCVR